MSHGSFFMSSSSRSCLRPCVIRSSLRPLLLLLAHFYHFYHYHPFTAFSTSSIVASDAPQMISYTRTSWFGFGYLFHLRGSAFPRCVPPASISVLVTWLIRTDGFDLARGAMSELGHPYVFQLVGIVFGYLIVTRINMSYARYWEGVTMIKQMHSKWADACGQVVAFDRSQSTECDLSSDPL